MKFKNIMGTITVVVIVGSVIYAIKKAHDARKLDEESISVEEARDEVNARRATKIKQDREIPEVSDEPDTNEDAPLTQKEVEEVKKVFVKESVEESDKVYDEPEEDIDEEEGGGRLRYDPNSIEAKKQYIHMELADISHSKESWLTLVKLFDFPFKPSNDGDQDLRHALMDYRKTFFGYGSKYTPDISYADVILHYARLSNFNLDDSIEEYVEDFLEAAKLSSNMSSVQIDDQLRALNSHSYYNDDLETFGLFGLEQDYMDEAIGVANQNIDKAVTYEIEFNQYITQKMES